MSTVIEDIVKWASSKLPPWQQEALRRIIELDTLSEKDIAELTTLCISEQDPAKQHDSVQFKISKSCDNSTQTGVVNFCAIEEIKGVNALAPNQKLVFGNSGLTVIYGDNGAGKTGYSRIIKHLTRCRGIKEEILPHFANDKNANKQEAKITYSVNGNVNELLWSADVSIPCELGQMMCFP